jgi:hypothetical protein
MVKYKECRHVMRNGLHCKPPAVRGCVFWSFYARAPPCSSPGAPPPSARAMHRSPLR